MFNPHNFKLMMDIAAEHGIEQKIVIECHAGLFSPELRQMFKIITNPESSMSPCSNDAVCEECLMTSFCQVKDKPRQPMAEPYGGTLEDTFTKELNGNNSVLSLFL